MMDTLAAAKHLQSVGVDNQHAEAIVHVMARENDGLVTTDDLKSALHKMELKLTLRVGVMLVAAVAVMETLDKLY